MNDEQSNDKIYVIVDRESGRYYCPLSHGGHIWVTNAGIAKWYNKEGIFEQVDILHTMGFKNVMGQVVS